MKNVKILILMTVFFLPVPGAIYPLEYYDIDAEGIAHVDSLVITPDSLGEFKKPVFFIEGFDPNDGTDNEFSISDLLWMLYENGIQSTLLEKGYTIVIVDLTSNWYNLAYQALALGNLLQKIWDYSRKREPLKIVGFSMGGLVATAALASRFDTNSLEWDFRCNLLLTYDSPHSGAYVSAGFYGFAEYYRDMNEDADQFYDALTCDSADQMLLMGYTSASRAEHAFWQGYYNNYLDIVANTPGLRFAGIVNGSWNGILQNDPSPLGIIIHWQASILMQVYLYKQHAWSMAAECSRFLKPVETYYHYSSTPNLEEAPGGNAPFYEILHTALQDFGGEGIYYDFNPAFVNTFSAAALPYGTYAQYTNFHDLETQLGDMEQYSPLQKIYHHDGNNQSHCYISEDFKQAFYYELSITTITGLWNKPSVIINYLLDNQSSEPEIPVLPGSRNKLSVIINYLLN